ncbi:hypothetical protein ACFE04_029439 [Oxalis oulophora]
MWDEIPIDIFLGIFQRLILLKHKIVVGSVCKSWKLIMDQCLDKVQLPPIIPWLMLAQEDTRGLQTNQEYLNAPRGFYNLSDNQIYYLDLPETINRKCWSVGFGSFVTVDLNLEIYLLQAFSKRQIKLPHQTSFSRQYPDGHFNRHETRDRCIKKVVVSSNPWDLTSHNYNQDCVVMTIYCGMLAFAKLGDNSWTDVHIPSCWYKDIAYYNSKFYATGGRQIYVCNFDDNYQHLDATYLAYFPMWVTTFFRPYLVESCGELLLICRNLSKKPERKDVTESFDVLKLIKKSGTIKCAKDIDDIDDIYDFDTHELVRVENLGDQAIFIGDNASFSFHASAVQGCKSNCIYFTDDCPTICLEDMLGGSDMGIYNLENGIIDRHYDKESLSHFCTPLWFI